jgi:PDDEXK-like domain of unknown function (DUF3799)
MLHPEGIYFFMSATEYHSDPSLGSTNIRDLIASPRRFWDRSWMNPKRDLYAFDEETDATVLGTALHCYTLDGRDVFAGKYSRRPDDAPGATSAEKSAITKKANAEAKLRNQISLHGDEWRFCETSGELISEHQDLKDLFVGGDHEVSVFWVNAHGIPCKARFDILKPRGIADIKSIANESMRRLEISAKLRIKTAKYHIQAEHYLEGRRQLPKLVADEKIFMCVSGKSLVDNHVSAIERMIVCAKQKQFAFVLVFVSKSTPECWACTLSPGNPILVEARDRIETAFDTYRDLRERYGTKPWPQDWRLGELYMEEMPGGEFGWN